jgi:DNA-binding NarL/FixJ family response regulator
MVHTPVDGSPLILVVDPLESDREAGMEIMRRAGYATLAAESGEEAVDVARRERPSVVVLEVCLPGISGYEVCRELRERFGESLGIVFISGTRTEPYDRVGGLLLGADDYLAKPFAADELLARVQKLVRRLPPPVPADMSNLTRRQHEVLQLVADGLDPKEIASRLSISPKTVGSHMERIFAKLGVHSRAEATASAHRDGLVGRGLLHSLAVPLALSVGDLTEWLSTCGTALGS